MVFVTAYDEYALEAFEVRASDYLLKPPAADRLAEALERVCEARSHPRTPPEDLSLSRSTPAARPGWSSGPTHLGGVPGRLRQAARRQWRQLLVRLPISLLAERWADFGFVRIHRGYLVALRHITELSARPASPHVRVGNTELPVSRRHTRELRDRLVRAAGAGGCDEDPAADAAGPAPETGQR